MDRSALNRFLYDLAELGSVALFITTILVWAGAASVI